MPRWKKTKTGPMRRAYLKPLMAKPKNTGLNKQGMADLYNHMQDQGHNLAFNALAREFAGQNEKAFRRIQTLMEIRARMSEKNIHNARIKEEFLHVTLQQSKYFKLVMFWGTGAGKYFFVKHRIDMVSISKPYESRASAMDAHSHHDIFWLDFIKLTPTV